MLIVSPTTTAPETLRTGSSTVPFDHSSVTHTSEPELNIVQNITVTGCDEQATKEGA